MNLSAVFTAVAYKRLVLVDLPGMGSNQHELNGVAKLREFFPKREKVEGRLRWHYFADDKETTQENGKFTFYDARAKSAGRTGREEWRFYYDGEFLRAAGVGDWLFLLRTNLGVFHGLVFEYNSGWLRAARTLFGVEQIEDSFQSMSKSILDAQRLELLRTHILAELDLDVEVPAVPSDEELMLEKFGRTFPTTRIMSHFARSQVEVDVNRVDETLVRWLEREEQLFRSLENVIIGERLSQGFANVDAFITYSLSVQNRRKSRMGYALQNHLEELFKARQLRYTAQGRTEGNNRPDFLFPGEKEYQDFKFDASLLVMLGVKSSSKDRWRQVLAEAVRVPVKHLCTLEQGISTRQTDEMSRQQLMLVVPEPFHETYSPTQRIALLSVAGFVEFVRRKQF